ncbi:hypothetical protein B296_00007462 [Ensete ventricosum]|uniref:Uncharacterized protein n=1 Tax=Ensete ventricosum TaxID=4639 RepID=A0A426ZWE7_ENSVE|nr:hypothetical protein B296_00007462 [Ensete ventricosum]
MLGTSVGCLVCSQLLLHHLLLTPYSLGRSHLPRHQYLTMILVLHLILLHQEATMSLEEILLPLGGEDEAIVDARENGDGVALTKGEFFNAKLKAIVTIDEMKDDIGDMKEGILMLTRPASWSRLWKMVDSYQQQTTSTSAHLPSFVQCNVKSHYEGKSPFEGPLKGVLSAAAAAAAAEASSSLSMDELQELVVQSGEREPEARSAPRLELTVEEAIEEHVGSLGFAQLVHIFLVSLARMFDAQNTLITIFGDAQPAWRCTPSSSSSCSSSSSSDGMCGLDRGAWEWVGGNKSSIIAEWGLVCDRRFIVGIPASFFFLGSLFGMPCYQITMAKQCINTRSGISFL